VNTAGGAFSNPPDSLAGFKGPTSKEMGQRIGDLRGRGRGWRGKGMGNGEGREGVVPVLLFPHFEP